MKKNHKIGIGIGIIMAGISALVIGPYVVSSMFSLISVPSGTSLIIYALT